MDLARIEIEQPRADPETSLVTIAAAGQASMNRAVSFRDLDWSTPKPHKDGSEALEAAPVFD